ncbi:MAG TPA: hypothetical protein VE955_04515 [Candidatus Dormibacteraeota bacterium]|jgi:hypothetical protein|nr:hypothetical protein [Candidatus Dormibacteraeota bacterium]
MEEIEVDRDADARREALEERREFEKVKVRMVARAVIGVTVAAAIILAGF